MQTPAAARGNEHPGEIEKQLRRPDRCGMPCARTGSYLAGGTKWQMLAVKAGKSSPAANYTAQHRPTARSSRRYAAPSLPALSSPAIPAPCGQACCRHFPLPALRLDVLGPGWGGRSAGGYPRCDQYVEQQWIRDHWPGIIMYHYLPITMNGRLLTPERRYFCVLKLRGRDPDRLVWQRQFVTFDVTGLDSAATA